MNKRRLSQASLLRLPIMVQTSNLLFPGPGKSKMVQTSNLLFPNPGKSKMVQTSNLLFPGPGKSKTARLPICFFPAREKTKWFRLPICFFPAREKAKWFRLPFCFFPGKSKMYQTCSLESGLETSSACGTRAHKLLLISLAPYPLGHSSLKNVRFSRLYKRKLDVQFAFPICFFPRVTTVLYAHLQP